MTSIDHETYRERLKRENIEAGNIQVPFSLECLFNHRKWITKVEYERFTSELKTFLQIKD